MRSRLLLRSCLLLTALAFGAACEKKKEPPPEAPAPPPPPSAPPAPEPLQPLIDDAAVDAAPAPPPKHAGGGGGGGGGANVARARQCCEAIRKQAKALGPSPEANQLIQAATLCDTVAVQLNPSGAGLAPEFAAVRALLQGRTVPPLCQGF